MNIVNAVEHTKCYGCGACANACPLNIVKMSQGDDGFFYPTVVAQDCTTCGLCIKACPAIEAPRNIALDNPKVLLAQHKHRDFYPYSASGAVFPALASIIIERGGVVFAPSFDDGFDLSHREFSNINSLDTFCGSKYVQSTTGTTFQRAEQHLKDDCFVLYTGTPCQIAGLRKYLDKEYTRLITADFICHGVPSNALFKEHVRWLEKRHKGLLTNYSFRKQATRQQHTSYCYTYVIKKRSRISTFSGSFALDPYYAAFFRGETYRVGCYQCIFADIKRVSDITMADSWDAGKYQPELAGIPLQSFIMVNTEKARALLPALKDLLDTHETSLSYALKEKENLSSPTPKPNHRNALMREIGEFGYTHYADAFVRTKSYRLRRITSRLPRQWIKAVKRFLP